MCKHIVTVGDEQLNKGAFWVAGTWVGCKMGSTAAHMPRLLALVERVIKEWDDPRSHYSVMFCKKFSADCSS